MTKTRAGRLIGDHDRNTLGLRLDPQPRLAPSFKRDAIRDKAPTFGFKAEGRVVDLKKAGRGSSRSQ